MISNTGNIKIITSRIEYPKHLSLTNKDSTSKYAILKSPKNIINFPITRLLINICISETYATHLSAQLLEANASGFALNSNPIPRI